MVRIYIRHAEKLYSNGEGSVFKHDPGITEEGIEKTKLLTQFLVDKYGIPPFIVCSPYERTRRTAIVMGQTLQQIYGVQVTIKCDINLSEYLGNHRKSIIDITPDTAKFNPPHPERWCDFDRRIRLHNKIMSELDSYSGAIWFICHGVVLSHISKLNHTAGSKRIRKISPLGCLYIGRSEENTGSDIKTTQIYLPRNIMPTVSKSKYQLHKTDLSTSSSSNQCKSCDNLQDIISSQKRSALTS